MDAVGYKCEFSVAPIKRIFPQIKNVQNNGKSVKQHILQIKKQKLFFNNDLNILLIQIYSHSIPLFQGMILYFKAKK